MLDPELLNYHRERFDNSTDVCRICNRSTANDEDDTVLLCGPPENQPFDIEGPEPQYCNGCYHISCLNFTEDDRARYGIHPVENRAFSAEELDELEESGYRVDQWICDSCDHLFRQQQTMSSELSVTELNEKGDKAFKCFEKLRSEAMREHGFMQKRNVWINNQTSAQKNFRDETFLNSVKNWKKENKGALDFWKDALVREEYGAPQGMFGRTLCRHFLTHSC